jgi:nuclease HARBI1
MFGPVNGHRHDATVLRRSRILAILRDVCRGGPLAWHGAPNGLGADYCIFGDSAYPLSTFLYRMYKGVMAPWQQAFNRDMSAERIGAEWSFGKMVNLWPFLDYRKKHKVLLSPVGRLFAVGNVLTNMHTILSGGNIVSRRYGLEPPSLEAYMSGGPY